MKHGIRYLFLSICWFSISLVTAQEASYEPISADNIQQTRQVGSLGTGYSYLLDYVDEQTLSLVSEGGIWTYDLTNQNQPQWVNYNVAFPIARSSDLRWILSYRGGLWDTETQTMVYDFADSSNYASINGIFSSDNRFVAIWQENVMRLDGESCLGANLCLEEVILWDIDAQVRRLTLQEEGVDNITFAGNGRYLAVMNAEETRFYATSTGQLQFIIPVPLRSFSADGWSAIHWQSDTENTGLPTRLDVWNLRTRHIDFYLNFLANENLSAMSLNADGSRLFVASVMIENYESLDFMENPKTIAVWDVAAQVRVASFVEDSAFLHEFIISPNGRYFATFARQPSYGDLPFSVYDLWTGQVYTFQPNYDDYSRDVMKLVFSPNGNELALLYRGAEIALLRFDGTARRMVLEGFRGYSVDLAFTDKQIFLTNQRQQTFTWDMNSLELQEQAENCRLYALHPSGLSLCGTVNDYEEMFTLDNGVMVVQREGQYENLLKAVFSPDAKYLAATTSQGAVVLWETATGEIVHIFNDTGGSLSFTLAFIQEGRYLIGGYAGAVWDMQSFEQVAQVRLPPIWQSQFAFNEAQNWLAFPSTDNRIYIWRLSDLLNGTDATAENAITSFAFAPPPSEEGGDIGPFTASYVYMEASPDGRLLAVSGTLIYDMQIQSIIHRIPDSGNLLRFSPDGRLLIIGDGEWYCGCADESLQIGYARVWAVPSVPNSTP